jgi:manganese/zinc/iron transport system substrate-binding protein
MTIARNSIAAALAAGFAVAAPALARAEEGPLRVVATVGMVADVARNVGGACVDVTTLMGPGTDPHEYQATAGDVRRLGEAELILYAGYMLEEQMSRVLDRLAAARPALALMEAATDPAELIADEDGAAGIDMHLWMDASLWARLAPAFAEALAELRPDCAEAAHAGAEAYAAKLEALHLWVGEAIASIPEETRTLVTAHDAFEYYSRAYGIEVVAVQGISTMAEASVADIRETVDAVVAAGVPAVFVETTINPRTIQAVVEAVRQRGHAVEIGGELHSDALGPEGTLADSYVGMIFENTRVITQALGGTVPPLPGALGPWAAERGLRTG